MNAEQLETDLAAAEQAVADSKAAAEATRQELQDQYKQRDATTVRISSAAWRFYALIPNPPSRWSWRKQRHCMRRNLLI